MDRSLNEKGRRFSVTRKNAAVGMLREMPNATPEEKVLIPIINRLRSVAKSLLDLDMPDFYDIEQELEGVDMKIQQVIAHHRKEKYLRSAGGDMKKAIEMYNSDLKKHHGQNDAGAQKQQ